MKLYEVEVGATYWVAAENVQQALGALWECWAAEGTTEDVNDGDYLNIDTVPGDKAKTLRFDDGCEVHPGQLMLEVASKCTEAEVIGCSEWP